MIPKAFDYAAPKSVDEALSLLAEGGEGAKLLAGGHSLIPLLKLRLAEPTLLVDLGQVHELRGVRPGQGTTAIGAMTRHADLLGNASSDVAMNLLAECAAQIGDTQVRNRGTLGGSLAHADPAADLTAVALALNAELEVARKNGGTPSTRRIPAGEFFTALLTTVLEPSDVLTTIHIPALPAGTGAAYVKLRNKASHYALVGVAAVVRLDGDRIVEASMAVTGAAATPFRVPAAETALQGGAVGNGAVDHAADLVTAHDVQWIADLHGSADYRQHMAGVVARRALRLAVQRARA